MNNVQIEKALGKNAITGKTFRGVFPPDYLPAKTLATGESLVVNYCLLKSGGCHWLAILRPGPGQIEIFDSSGIATHVTNPNINKFVMKHGLKVVYNRKPLQDFDSSVCGQHVILYIFLRCIKISRQNILSLYEENNLKLNDKIVMEMYKKFF